MTQLNAMIATMQVLQISIQLRHEAGNDHQSKDGSMSLPWTICTEF
jgi:hypothetical protein